MSTSTSFFIPVEHLDSWQQRVREATLELVKKHGIATDALTENQIADALRQAIECGDFIRHVVANDGRQTVVYIPFAREQRLEAQLAAIRELVESFGLSIQARAELQKHWDQTFDAMAAIDRLLTTLGILAEFGDLDLKAPKFEVPIVKEFSQPAKPEPPASPLKAFLARKRPELEPETAPLVEPPAAPLVVTRAAGLVDTIKQVLPSVLDPFTAIGLRTACRNANPSLGDKQLGNINAWLDRACEKGVLKWDAVVQGYFKNGHPKPISAAPVIPVPTPAKPKPTEVSPATASPTEDHNGKPVRDLNAIARERIAALEAELDTITSKLEDMKKGPVRETWQEKADAIMAEIKKNELLLA